MSSGEETQWLSVRKRRWVALVSFLPSFTTVMFTEPSSVSNSTSTSPGSLMMMSCALTAMLNIPRALEPSVAMQVTVQLPGAWAETTPFWSTVATRSLLLVQVSALLSASSGSTVQKRDQVVAGGSTTRLTTGTIRRTRLVT